MAASKGMAHLVLSTRHYEPALATPNPAVAAKAAR
jgi:hypothetical protein